METRRGTQEAKYQSDTYRSERCNRCGGTIGFGFFDARKNVFTHRDRETYEFPAWCQPKETR